MSIFERSEMLLGEAAIKKLSESRVAVFGIGGVGSYTVEALVRCGIGNLTLIDGDTVSESNINRQLVATTKTVGIPKATVAAEHAKEVNPEINVIPLVEFYGAENENLIDFADYDYIVDAIDTVTSKLMIIEKAHSVNTPVISCMGAGNKLDPTKFEVANISKTSVCPLARVMRQELRKRGINHVKVVYSKEEPIKHGVNENGKPLPGSVSFVPSAAGLILAGEVIKDLIK